MTLAIIIGVALSWYLLVMRNGPLGVFGDQYALSGYLQSFATVWHLYTNNHTPASNDTPASYTELTNSGYASVTISTSGWTLTNQTTFYQGTASNITFTFTGSATVYGYYVTVGADYWGGELFTSGPFVFGTGSNALILSPKVTMGP